MHEQISNFKHFENSVEYPVSTLYDICNKFKNLLDNTYIFLTVLLKKLTHDGGCIRLNELHPYIINLLSHICRI